MQKQVKAFHKEMGLKIGTQPHALIGREALVRSALIAEEFAEFLSACAKEDVVDQADALADLLYVTLGAAVASGIDIEKCFEEVHKSNMSKVGGRINSAGKLIKPDSYKKPNLEKIVKK